MGYFSKASRDLIVCLLSVYRYFMSPFLGVGNRCRFHPSCSEYALTAIQQLPVCKGLALIIWRLLRCHPFCAGGYDPVPFNQSEKK